MTGFLVVLGCLVVMAVLMILEDRRKAKNDR